jgi:competence protein ComFC
MLLKIYNKLLDLLFPVECVGCEIYGTYLCDNCLEKIKPSASSACVFCGKNTILTGVCESCRQESGLDGVLIAVDYDQPYIHDLIWSLKFGFVQEMSQSLAKIIKKWTDEVNAVNVLKLNDSLVAPIPLHKKRFIYRGFNQAELIAKNLTEHFPDWHYADLLIKTKNTKSQLEFGREERLLNLQDAFTATQHLNGQTVIIIDDVVTTGSTLTQAAIALKSAGAARVYGLVCAKRNST